MHGAFLSLKANNRRRSSRSIKLKLVVLKESVQTRNSGNKKCEAHTDSQYGSKGVVSFRKWAVLIQVYCS